MGDVMLDQLQALEQLLMQIKNQHNITTAELASIKHQMAQDDHIQQIQRLQENLNLANEEIGTLTAKANELTEFNSHLENQISQLNEKNQLLTEKNKEILDKYSLVVSRVDIIQEWLNKIDHQNA